MVQWNISFIGSDLTEPSRNLFDVGYLGQFLLFLQPHMWFTLIGCHGQSLLIITNTLLAK